MPVASPADDHDALLAALRDGQPLACRLIAAWARGAITRPQLRIPADEVDDLVQETLAQVLDLSGRDDFVVRASFKALVRRVALARAIDWIRRRRILTELAPDLQAAFDDPVERLAFTEDLERVHAALTELKPLCRDLIRWHFNDEQPYAAIAARTGRHEGTLRVHMLNCLRALRSLLEA